MMPSQAERTHCEHERIKTLPRFPHNQSFEDFKARIEELRDGGKNAGIAAVEEWKGFRYDPPTNKGFVLFLPGEGELRALIFTRWRKCVFEVCDLSQQKVRFSEDELISLHFTNICLLQDATREYFEIEGFLSPCLDMIYDIYKILENHPLRTRILQELAQCPAMTERLSQEIAEFEKKTINPALAEIAKLEAEIERRRTALRLAQTFIIAIKGQ